MQGHVREAVPSLYETASYATIEISGELAARQAARLAAEGHANRFSVRHGSALEARGWGPPSNDLTYVLMCEVRLCVLALQSMTCIKPHDLKGKIDIVLCRCPLTSGTWLGTACEQLPPAVSPFGVCFEAHESSLYW